MDFDPDTAVVAGVEVTSRAGGLDVRLEFREALSPSEKREAIARLRSFLMRLDASNLVAGPRTHRSFRAGLRQVPVEMGGGKPIVGPLLAESFELSEEGEGPPVELRLLVAAALEAFPAAPDEPTAT